MGDWFQAADQSHLHVTASSNNHDEIPFRSRRSPILALHGCVASSQPLATGIGLDILKKNGNAADAAVAVAAALAVTEPCSTGLGGDMFCLYYQAKDREVYAINGSGKSPRKLSFDLLREVYPDGNGNVDAEAFRESPHAVTVPGAAKGWEDLWKRHGSGNFSFEQLLEPAARLAEEGFPVGPITAHHWSEGMKQILQWRINPDDQMPLTMDGFRGPKPGEVMQNRDLAEVLRLLGQKGAEKGFYSSRVGHAIVDAVNFHGGCLTLQDLVEHASTFPDPIKAEYRGCNLWQVPPNGQGLAGLVALKGLQALEDSKQVPVITPENIHSTDTIHAMVEMMRLGFADNRAFVADPDFSGVHVESLLDTNRISARATKLFDRNKAVIQGIPDASSCTVSFQVVDDSGNAISFVNSNFMGFGTGIIPKNCGFTLQNRGFGFTLEENHPNSVKGRKRPYHTIIPGMITHADTGELYATISNMGGNMQPQGHFQLMTRMLAGGMDPQAAVDAPRFCIADGTQSGKVFFEEGFDDEVLSGFESKGHAFASGLKGHARSVFGRAQVIKRDRSTKVLWAGSDGRADGCAMGY